jgi:predicted glycoside hydrolase/deacetylase ChbG (UPF0249 family)
VKSDLNAVATLLREPANAESYRRHCDQAPAIEAQLESIARKTGIPIRQAREPNRDPRTNVDVSFKLGEFMLEGIEQSYRAYVTAFCLADVFRVDYFATMTNHAPAEMRLYPFLKVDSRAPLIASMTPIENRL